MKKIYSANLQSTGTTNANGECCEWQYCETNEEEHGKEYNGDVKEFWNNLFVPDEMLFEIIEDYSGSIHNLPENAIVVGFDKNPTRIYWAE